MALGLKTTAITHLRQNPVVQASKQKRASLESNGRTAGLNNTRRTAGGAATGGGINFQGAVTAIAFSYLLRGRPLKWIEGLHDDVPTSVSAETGGAGDDIRLHLRGEKRCEVQVKRGLRSGDDLWASLLSMSRAIADRNTDFAVLAVSPTSSKTIREELATAIIRLGDGRNDNLPAIGTLFVSKLTNDGLDPKSVCQALRIVTISAMKSDAAAIGAARAELGHACQNDDQIEAAWNALYHDAIELIDRRGRRELSSLVTLLRTSNITLSDDTSSPATLLSRLSDWTVQTNATFTIFGVPKQLRLNEAWIPLQAIVRDDTEHPADLKEALLAYQAWHDRQYSREATIVDPETLGRFIKLAVLVAGPGMGKTTLLSRIAHRYAIDGIPVLRVRLSAVAARMRSGSTFEEAVFAHGLAGSDIPANAAISAGLRNWVLLCDGLDETGTSQLDIAAAAERFAQGHPEARVIVTTRPLGYHANNLRSWRHYDIVPLDQSAAPDHLSNLLREIGGEGSEADRDLHKIAKAELREEGTAKAVSRSPLLLALSASLIARGGTLAVSRPRLYERLFTLIDEAPNSRIPEPPAEAAILRRFLDILAWEIVADPIASVDAVLARCSEILADETGLKRLTAHGAAQSYLRYWQDVGLIERVGHGDAETLTFIHKTFGEFAAGRNLANMLPAQRAAAFLAIGTSDAWFETLSFAALTGVPDDVCAHLMTEIELDTDGITRIARCLEICGESQLGPNAPNRERIIGLAFDAIRSPRRRWAVKAGLALVPVARRFPNEIGPLCQDLLTAPQSWTRLVSWAALAAAGPPHLDLDRLQRAIVTEASLLEEGTWRSHSGGLVFDTGSEREIAQLLVLEGARQLLNLRPGQATDDAILEAFKLKGLGSIDFLSRASRLLKEHGKYYDLWSLGGYNTPNLFEAPERYLEAQRKAHTALFNAIDPSGEMAAHPVENKLLNLSAFLRLSGFWEVSAGDVWAWTHAFDSESVFETVRAAIAASGLDSEQLTLEVQSARRSLANQDTLTSLFQYTSQVDTPPMNWKLAAITQPNLEKIEAALYHRSDWMIWLAANLINEVADSETKAAIIGRALKNGSGKTLWAAAALSTTQKYPGLIGAIYDRLDRNPSFGCEHLIQALPGLGAPFDDLLLRALEIGFLKGNLATATESAEAAIHYASPERTEFLPVLEAAAEHWRVHEEPYPKKGGTVPGSPRKKIAEAIAAITAPTYDTLKAYASDSRGDVRELGRNLLVPILSEQPDLAHIFLNDIDHGRLNSFILDEALRNGVQWDDAALSCVEQFLSSPRDELCFAAMGLLQEPYRSPEAIREQATALTTHADRQIRERAFRLLDGIPNTFG